MGIRHYTYKDIPRATRARASSEAQKQLQAVLASPVTSAGQREEARRQQGIVRDWVAGTLPTEGGLQEPEGGSQDEPTAVPVEHSVVLDEAVHVAESDTE